MDTKPRGKAAAAFANRYRFFLVLALTCTGCKSLPSNPFAAGEKSAEPYAEREQPLAAAAKNADSAAAKSPDLKILESDSWFEQVGSAFAKRSESFVHWHHHQLDPLLHLSARNRPDLSSALASSNPVVVANAAIVLAHWRSEQGTQQLLDAVRATELAVNLRCAAAEALGKIDEPSPAEALRGLLSQFAPLSTQADEAQPAAPILPNLHAELIRSLSRHADPSDEEWFTDALRSKAWNVRYEGIAAWGVLPQAKLPAIAIDRRSDPDPRVRTAALRTIAAQRDPHAIEYLQQAMSDRSVEVHAIAIAGLGELGSEEAHSLLSKLKGHSSELSRAAAIAALAVNGMRDEVESAVKDESAQVRLAVANSLANAAVEGKQVAAQSVATAQSLARDASADVQRQAIESLSTWPLEQAGPVLLLAIAEGGYTARRSAAEQLAAHWQPAADFPVDAMAERRAAAWAELKALWIKQYGEINEAVVSAKAQAQQLISLSEQRIDEVQSLVATLRQVNLPEAARREAVAQLAKTGPQLVAVLEQRLGSNGPFPCELYDEVLPGVSPAFAALARLSSRDVLERRTAASELATQAAGIALSPLAVARLAELVETEKDPAVWRGALTAVANDTSDAAKRMAYTAIGNASVEVRRKACEYLAAHGDPRHVRVLLPALEDPDGTVVLAAIRALGAVDTWDDPRPLIRMLNLPDKQVRLEAALSLSRLRVEQGTTALERLALDADLEVRMRSAKAMGENRDPVFLPALMAMLNDKPDLQRVAMVSLAEIAGADPAAQADGIPLGNEEKIRRWQLWYREHQDRTASKQ